jgi:hypothetical protein
MPITEQITLEPLARQPAVRAAQALVDKLASEIAVIEAEIHRGRRATDPIEKREAEAAEPALVAQVRRLEAESAKARAALHETRERARARLVAEFARSKRPLVAALATALEKCREVNLRLEALEQDEHAMAGLYLDPAHWPSLTRSEPTRESFMDTWLDNVRERGLLD